MPKYCDIHTSGVGTRVLLFGGELQPSDRFFDNLSWPEHHYLTTYKSFSKTQICKVIENILVNVVFFLVTLSCVKTEICVSYSNHKSI